MDDPARFKPFSHLTAQNAGLYRQVMLAFVAAKRRFVVHLRTEDVAEALSGEDPQTVADALKQLVVWGNLRADPDTSRVTSVEDFHRARFLYQLTHAGETAERSLAVFDEQLGRRGALQAVALRDIAVGLRGLHALVGERDPDVGRTGLILRDLVGRCSDLADNAQAFMGSLQRTIDLYELEVDAFLAYKDRLIDYLERFIKDLTATGAEIAELLNRLPTLTSTGCSGSSPSGKPRTPPPEAATRETRPWPPSSPGGASGGAASASGSSPHPDTPARRSCCARVR